MNSFIDFGNLLEDNWELISRHPMLFVMYGALAVAVTLSVRRLFAKNKLDLELLREKNTWEEECCRERKRNSELEHKNRDLIEKTQILQNKNKEQGDRIREINKERIDLLRRTELLEDIIQGLETVHAQEQKGFLAKETITKPAVQREKQEQKVQTLDFDKILEEINHEIKRL